MKSITIHGIDAELDKKIAQKSAELGLSQNKTVKTLLKDSLLPDRNASRRESFGELFGKWSSQERDAFQERISELEKVHDSDWEA